MLGDRFGNLASELELSLRGYLVHMLNMARCVAHKLIGHTLNKIWLKDEYMIDIYVFELKNYDMPQLCCILQLKLARGVYISGTALHLLSMHN